LASGRGLIESETFFVKTRDIHKEFRDALVKAGYPAETHPVVHFGIQSQETVDRDYGGSWYEASEMP